jgi:DNA-binding transcriptional LysR family regulator
VALHVLYGAAFVDAHWKLYEVMELRQLRYFIAVAEEQHYARAAAKVGIDQSPLSRAIARLERDLGVQLFVRTTRATRITPAGVALLQAAKEILSLVDHARTRVREISALDRQSVPPTVAPTVVEAGSP